MMLNTRITFAQVDGSSTRRHEGTGLGLAISKRLIEEHGGRIVAENVQAGGARVTVWLPSAPEMA